MYHLAQLHNGLCSDTSSSGGMDGLPVSSPSVSQPAHNRARTNQIPYLTHKVKRRHLNLKSFGIHGKRTNSMAKLKKGAVRRRSGSLKMMWDCVGSRRILYGVCETAHLPSSNVNVRRSGDFKCRRNNSHQNQKVE